MKQPELGKKISEIRKQKGFTQEEVVELCNINVRTIQRIEAGEVTPRSYTIKSIIEALGLDVNIFFKETEKKTNDFTKKERGILTISWVIGIFFLCINIIGVLMEFTFFESNSTYQDNLYFRIPFGIVFLITLIIFLRGYKLLAEKNNNIFLVHAVYIYIILTSLMILINIGITAFNTNEILAGILMVILFGIAEILIGFGILKLEKYFGELPKIVGIIKIANGTIFLTVFLSPIAWFLIFPIMLLEIIFLYNFSKVNR